MPRGVKMFGRMAIGRRITTAHMATDQTDAQMHPAAADLETIFTALGAGRYFLNLCDMFTDHVDAPCWVRYTDRTRIGPIFTDQC